jgi:hypothetical protein
MSNFEFKVVEFAVQEFSKGGITLKHPDKVGVTVEGLPAALRERLQNTAPVTKTIFTYQSRYRGLDPDDWFGVGRIRAVDPDGSGPKAPTDDISDRWTPETGNIKLRCICQWNGPEVTATFDLAPDGMRARHGTEASIDIKPQLNLSTAETGDAWKKIGINRYPVVYLPVSIFIDEPWPSKNYKASFNLVLSGMYGFGITGSGDFQESFESSSDR